MSGIYKNGKIVADTRLHTYSELHTYFLYEEDTGKLYWKIKKNKALPGHECKTLHPMGYLAVQLDGIGYLVHRIIWCMVYGEFPPMTMYHKNDDRKDNKLSNLQLKN